MNYKKPVLYNLMSEKGIDGASAVCDTGSGDAGNCDPVGNSAGVRCITVGGSADEDCRVGNSANEDCQDGISPIAGCGDGSTL